MQNGDFISKYHPGVYVPLLSFIWYHCYSIIDIIAAWTVKRVYLITLTFIHLITWYITRALLELSSGSTHWYINLDLITHSRPLPWGVGFGRRIFKMSVSAHPLVPLEPPAPFGCDNPPFCISIVAGVRSWRYITWNYFRKSFDFVLISLAVLADLCSTGVPASSPAVADAIADCLKMRQNWYITWKGGLCKTKIIAD